MSGRGNMLLSRRSVLQGGALVVGFALLPAVARAQQEEAEVVNQADWPPGSLGDYPYVDSWIRIDSDGAVTVFTGKAELGQGIKTALVQVAAEQLQVATERVSIVTADTDRTPDEGFTAASHSLEESGTAIMHAAAQARRVLLELAAERLGQPIEALEVSDGIVTGTNGQSASYGDLVSDELLHVQVARDTPLRDPEEHAVMGRPAQRLDIPAKVTGQPAYVHDLRMPGMVHARVVRPPSGTATLESVDTGPVEQLPGVIQVVRDGSFLAVVAEGEYQAVRAMAALSQAARWQQGQPLLDEANLYDEFRRLPAEDYVVHEKGTSTASSAGSTVEAVYRRPYQMHASIGPSCAVGLYQDGRLTVWSHTQGAYPDRAAIAELLSMPAEQVRVVHMEGAGCYGHNGADDAAADVALIARAVPDRPVRLQWMREQEHGWEPYGSAMIVEARAVVDDAGEIADWNYEVWSNPHSTRPGPAGALIAGRLVANAFPPQPPQKIPQPAGGGDRNAVPPYTLPRARVVEHFVTEMPLRVSALRSLGAYTNVFALESFMDELAEAAKADPVEFRLRRLEDPRARDVLSRAAETFGWSGWQRRGPGHGRGIAYARYKNLAAYCAVAMELEVDRNSGAIRLLRAVAASDSGQIVNPDGVRNQIEGGIVQSASWTLFERVRFSQQEITSIDWAGYPIMRFASAPLVVEVEPIDRPGAPFLGTGEASQGPTAAAIANAFADATSVRLRELPFTRDRVRAALRA